MKRLLVAIAFLGLNFYIYHFFATEEAEPPREEFSSFPLELGGWRCDGIEEIGEAIKRNLGVSDYLNCIYARQDPMAVVGVYVGYHATQIRREGGGAGENSIHPPAHCLPGSGWSIIGSKRVALDLPGLPVRPAQANRLIISKGEARQLVYYWYQSRGRVIAHDWRKTVYLFWDRATRHRTDGSLVRFSIPLVRGDEEQAEQAFAELSAQIVPRLVDYVPN